MEYAVYFTGEYVVYVEGTGGESGPLAGKTSRLFRHFLPPRRT
jgi:hypothetical protein